MRVSIQYIIQRPKPKTKDQRPKTNVQVPRPRFNAILGLWDLGQGTSLGYERIWDRAIAGRTELDDLRSRRRPRDEPRSTRRTEHGGIELSVPVIIARCDYVTIR